MIPLKFLALPEGDVTRYRASGVDANGQLPERHISDGQGNPCRYCLQEIPEGAEMLILAHRPFPAAQPYAEVGPIFLCADRCARASQQATTPQMFLKRDRLMLRGYGADDRIVYGTGRIVSTDAIDAAARDTFADPAVRYLHLRSASNNCYHARIERG